MKATLTFLHQQCSDWQRELDFYKDEAAVLRKRLEEVITKNNNQDIAAQVEHFQNKLIILRDLIDRLKHDVHTREQQVEKISAENPEQIDNQFSVMRGSLHTDIKSFVTDFTDFRIEFNQFLAKVL